MTYKMTPTDCAEVLIVRTVPVQTIADFAPYHWTLNSAGQLSLRAGAPPKAVVDAVAAYASGKGSINEMLDKIGVPKPRASR